MEYSSEKGYHYTVEFYGPVHQAYNPHFSACFFSRNSIFLSQQISQQYFSVGLSAQPNGTYIHHMSCLFHGVSLAAITLLPWTKG
jgi:hypothetical protein